MCGRKVRNLMRASFRIYGEHSYFPGSYLGRRETWSSDSAGDLNTEIEVTKNIIGGTKENKMVFISYFILWSIVVGQFLLNIGIYIPIRNQYFYLPIKILFLFK